ncbi:hypothetical protein BDP27DRAFT_1422744 [Rhodocollybia butyracea]|uniref:Uncharacterized protein n=1 Tax=Rhodocollybia butyracea TaxID=206335 RepID=A0A9P5PL15_9AGAR|nr:hypothetical protein BDP27DRAFT_1422744 [Rhodocollybia butyracea]
MSSLNQAVHKHIEDAVRVNRERSGTTRQRQHTVPVITPTSQLHPTRPPSPVASSAHSLTAQSSASFSHRTVGSNSGLPPTSTSSQLDGPSEVMNILNLTGCMTKKSEGKKPEGKKPEYPPGSRLIPNTSGSKEAASTARYRLDSNDLRLEGMFRTEQALTKEHIQRLDDTVRQTGENFRSTHDDLAQDYKVIHGIASDVSTRVRELERTRESYDSLHSRVDELEQLFQVSQQVAPDVSFHAGYSLTPPPDQKSGDSVSPACSEIFERLPQGDDTFPSMSPPSRQGTPPLLQRFTSPPARSNENVADFTPLDLDMAMTPPSPCTPSPFAVPLSGRIQRSRSPPPERPAKRQKTHRLMPGSTVRVSTSDASFPSNIETLRKFLHTWFLRLDNNSRPLRRPSYTQSNPAGLP